MLFNAIVVAVGRNANDYQKSAFKAVANLSRLSGLDSRPAHSSAVVHVGAAK